MTVAHHFDPAAPYTKKQKGYLAILKLYSDRDITQICRILNSRFEDDLFRKRLDIDETMTDRLWSTLLAERDEVVVWAEHEGQDGWRTKRVMAYAEALDRGEEPLCSVM